MLERALLLVSFCGALLSVGLGLRYPDLSWRWVMFTLWLPPVLAALGFGVMPRGDEARATGTDGDAGAHEKEIYLWILLAVCAVYLIFLSTYPFIAIQDELRDGGWRAQSIATGTHRHIFSSDWSQGLYFASLVSLLYPFVGSDVLLYRLFGAGFAIAEISLLYFGLGRLCGYRFAFFSAIIVGLSQMHLFFARTESLISLSSLTTTIAFLLLVRISRAPPARLLPLASYSGMIFGLALGQHASARVPVALLVLGGAITLCIRWSRGLLAFRELLKAGGLAVIFVFVALGPQLLYLELPFILGIERLRLDVGGDLLVERFKTSLSLLTGKLVQGHYEHGQLIAGDLKLILPFAALFVLWKGAAHARFALACVPLILFTNSAMTEVLCQGQRLLPLVPLLAVGIAEFMSGILKHARYSFVALVLTGVVGARVFDTADFFLRDRATSHLTFPTQLPVFLTLRHLVNHIEQDGDWQERKTIYLYVRHSSPLYFQVNPMHVQEFFSFFFPTKKLVVGTLPNLMEGKIYLSGRHISSEASVHWKTLEFCPGAGYFACRQSFIAASEDVSGENLACF